MMKTFKEYIEQMAGYSSDKAKALIVEKFKEFTLKYDGDQKRAKEKVAKMYNVSINEILLALQEAGD